jgi:hypothetical protein
MSASVAALVSPLHCLIWCCADLRQTRFRPPASALSCSRAFRCFELEPSPTPVRDSPRAYPTQTLSTQPQLSPLHPSFKAADLRKSARIIPTAIVVPQTFTAVTNNFNARVMRNFELAAPHDEEGKFAFSPYMARRMGEAASDFKNGQFGLRQRQTLSRESALRTQAQQRNQQLQQTNVQLRESLADSQQHIATVCTRVV